MVEVEGNGNRAFAKLVVVNIQEEEAENFSMGGKQASSALHERIQGNNQQ